MLACRHCIQDVLAFGFVAFLMLYSTSSLAALVINEIDYDQPGIDNAEFVEIYNSGNSEVDLGGYSLVLINGNGNVIYQVITLSGIVAPQAFYVVCSNPNSLPVCDLATLGNIQNGPADGVGLVINANTAQQQVEDAVIYGGALQLPANDPLAIYIEGDPAVADSDALHTSISRISDGADTNNNSADFAVRCSSPGQANKGDALYCQLPAAACGEAATRIHRVQGNQLTSPLQNQVHTIEAVVTDIYKREGNQQGYFLQEEDAHSDANPLTSEALLILDSSSALNSGDLIRITGNVVELAGVTTMEGVRFDDHCGQVSLPSSTELSLPLLDINPLEALEAMRVHLQQSLYVVAHHRLADHGEFEVSSQARLIQATQVMAPGAAALELQSSQYQDRVRLVDTAGELQPQIIPFPPPQLSVDNTLRIGDRVEQINAIVHFADNQYRLLLSHMPKFVHGNLRPEPPQLHSTDPATVIVAGFNLENFFNGDGLGSGFIGSRGAQSLQALQRQKQKLVAAIVSMDADILVLTELENDGYTPQSSIAELSFSVNQAIANPTDHYAWIVPPVERLGSDAISVGMLYRTHKLEASGGAKILDASVDALFNSQKNRSSLAQKFVDAASGKSFIVVANHFKSKAGSCAAVGDPNLNDGQGECPLTRTHAAQALAAWLQKQFGPENILIMGDLNSYAKETPLQTLIASGYTDLVNTFLGQDAYSFVFNGQSGYLDHALANPSLLPAVADVTLWHINADEPDVLDYKEVSRSGGSELFAADAFRSSDHDPLLVALSLEKIKQVNVSGSGGGSLSPGTLFVLTLVLILFRLRFNRKPD